MWGGGGQLALQALRASGEGVVSRAGSGGSRGRGARPARPAHSLCWPTLGDEGRVPGIKVQVAQRVGQQRAQRVEEEGVVRVLHVGPDVGLRGPGTCGSKCMRVALLLLSRWLWVVSCGGKPACVNGRRGQRRASRLHAGAVLGARPACEARSTGLCRTAAAPVEGIGLHGPASGQSRSTCGRRRAPRRLTALVALVPPGTVWVTNRLFWYVSGSSFWMADAAGPARPLGTGTNPVCRCRKRVHSCQATSVSR